MLFPERWLGGLVVFVFAEVATFGGPGAAGGGGPPRERKRFSQPPEPGAHPRPLFFFRPEKSVSGNPVPPPNPSWFKSVGQKYEPRPPGGLMCPAPPAMPGPTVPVRLPPPTCLGPDSAPCGAAHNLHTPHPFFGPVFRVLDPVRSPGPPTPSTPL